MKEKAARGSYVRGPQKISRFRNGRGKVSAFVVLSLVWLSLFIRPGQAMSALGRRHARASVAPASGCLFTAPTVSKNLSIAWLR